MELDAKIYVAGHTGLVGSALIRSLQQAGYHSLITRIPRELDLRRQQSVEEFFAQEQPDYVFLAAAKVGGILANRDFPAQFIYDNLMIECNIINAAYRSGVKKLLFLGSSCIYPRDCPQPIQEHYLLSGYLESTNQPYAIAKIAGIELCQAYYRQYGMRSVIAMPTNLYGPGDNFDLLHAHVVPALIAKITQAHKQQAPHVTIWGSGNAQREFLYVDDLADACVYLMNCYEHNEIINIGTGTDITIRQLARLIQELVGYQGELVSDGTKPDGTPRKLLNSGKINALGWKARTSLNDGLAKTIAWYKANHPLKTL